MSLRFAIWKERWQDEPADRRTAPPATTLPRVAPTTSLPPRGREPHSGQQAHFHTAQGNLNLLRTRPRGSPPHRPREGAQQSRSRPEVSPHAQRPPSHPKPESAAPDLPVVPVLGRLSHPSLDWTLSGARGKTAVLKMINCTKSGDQRAPRVQGAEAESRPPSQASTCYHTGAGGPPSCWSQGPPSHLDWPAGWAGTNNTQTETRNSRADSAGD